ncbi:MAG: hypothetical protein ACRYFA_08740 [Janthinobacterium lividum]
MATLKTTVLAPWITPEHTSFDASFITKKYNTFADSQKANHTLWFLISLMIHGIVLIPMAWALVFFFNGPAALFMATSLICFFTSIIANMGGSGIRSTLLVFSISLFLHAAMVAYVLI